MKRQSDAKRREAALTDLAAGELSWLASWRLHREIARDADLRLEWERTQEVWAQLRELRAEAAPEKPRWPSPLEISTIPKRTVTIGGLTVNRRVAFAAVAAFSLCTVTAGAYVGQKWLIDPYLDAKDSHGHVWRAVGHFKGEVKKYDIDNHYLGSFGTDGGSTGEPTAEVTLDGHTYAVAGIGRHAIKNADGLLLGYVDLVPETDDERADGRKAYIKRQRVNELLPIGFGSVDQADGSEIGYFGNQREVQWTLTGDVDATFSRVDNGHVVYHGTATTKLLSDTEKAKRSIPTLTWTVDGKTQTLRGYGSTAEITLPAGIPVKVELVKRAD